jgi:hypothetical protein
MQWPHLERGSTLEDIRAALNKRGVYTHPVRWAGRLRLAWGYPVVLHFKGGEAGGHFAVWQPDPGHEGGAVWLGTQGGRTLDTDSLSRECREVVLLTSPAEITEADSAFPPSPWTRWVLSATVGVLALLVYLLARAARAPAPGGAPPPKEVHDGLETG